MKRPKLKKASKRLSCGKRYKIQKKVREHNRKLRKEAKKKGLTKRVKKDPGVPNVAPFKEEVLREAEQRKLMLEELKAKKKLEKQKERAEKRKKEAASPEDDPKPKKVKKETAKNPEKTSMDKFSRKFLCSELNKAVLIERRCPAAVAVSKEQISEFTGRLLNLEARIGLLEARFSEKTHPPTADQSTSTDPSVVPSTSVDTQMDCQVF